jgi:hypothetical protein
MNASSVEKAERISMRTLGWGDSRRGTLPTYGRPYR